MFLLRVLKKLLIISRTFLLCDCFYESYNILSDIYQIFILFISNYYFNNYTYKYV